MNGKQFLQSEFWILSWNASVNRSGVYEPGGAPEERSDFREGLVDYIESKILPAYQKRVREEEHLKHLSALVKAGNRIGKSVLGPDGYRFGVAQKLLNLQLKYLWCSKFIPEPPHCPVDRVMINKTVLKNQVAWTRMTSVTEYKKVIAAMRTEADKQSLSLARWELEVFDRRDA